MKKLCPMLLLILVLLCAPRPVRAEGERALTLMVYMCGSNLESEYGSASADIEEMLASGFDDRRVSLLVMTGGSERWKLGFDPDELTISEVGRRGLRTVWHESAASMGAAQTLMTLVDFGVERYPARDYALILWNHGGGPLEGLCWDELFSMDNLTLAELIEGLQAARLPDKLSWIGFDACLMSTAEVAAALSPYAHYMVASQETEPAKGWDYRFLKGLERDLSGADTGRRIVDAYFDALGDSPDALTLACTDLTRMEAVVQGMDAFFRPISLRLNADSFRELSLSRRGAAAFGKLPGVGEGGYDLVDLGDLVREYGSRADSLNKALSKAVVYCRSNREGVTGLSVYHPFANKRRFLEQWNGDYQGLTFSDGYRDYLKRFGALLTGDELADWTGLRTVEEGVDAHGAHVFSTQLSDEQRAAFASAQLMIIGTTFTDYHDPCYTPLFIQWAQLDEDGRLTASYDGRGIYLVDGQGEVVKGPLSFTPSSDPGRYNLLALYWDHPNFYYANRQTYVSYSFETPEVAGEDLALTSKVFDEVSDSFTNRIAFDEAEYRHLGFWYDLRRLPEGDDTLPGYHLWEQTGNTLLATLILPFDWRLRLMDA